MEFPKSRRICQTSWRRYEVIIKYQYRFNILNVFLFQLDLSVGGLGAKKAGKAGGKLGAVVQKIVLPVETDPVKLVNNVCGSNILKEGKDVELKPDSEYPDWLWTLRLGTHPINHHSVCSLH